MVFLLSHAIMDSMRKSEITVEMANPQVLEGTWEELKLHEEELSGKRFRLVPLESKPDKTASKAGKSQRDMTQEPDARGPRQLTGMGKFAGILPSSEEFMRQKQEEIELEERRSRDVRPSRV